MPTLPSFKFCAFRYLLQWLCEEQVLYNQISKDNPTIGDLRAAMHFFKISRSFPKISEQENAKKVLDSLLEIRAHNDFHSIEKVEELAKAFNTTFGKFNLSAASKLLWLSLRQPFIILDQRAITALKDEFKYKFNPKKYTAYCSAWKTEYAKHREEIEDAVMCLPKVREFTPNQQLSDEEILRLVKAPWFKERVFDNYLWEIGGSVNSKLKFGSNSKN